jgi:hypothetical protein
MWIINKKSFAVGLVMSLGFWVVLAIMFSPVFAGLNAFEAADRLFNSIAKGSSYHIEELRETNRKYQGAAFQAEITLKDAELTGKAQTLITRAGAGFQGGTGNSQVRGDLGALLAKALDDADLMFNGRGKEVAAQYGYPEKEALFVWWTVLKEIQKDFQRQQKFGEALHLEEVLMKGVEVGYNFYGIETKRASSNMVMLTASLLFYILYTLWWGYAILWVFEGLGLQMKASAKKEV